MPLSSASSLNSSDDQSPRLRLREPTVADEPNIVRIRTLCAKWGRDPDDFTTRYLNLTARSEFFRQHPDRALDVFVTKYLCANPIDGRTQESAEVAPDAHEIDVDLPLEKALSTALRASQETPAPSPVIAPAKQSACSYRELQQAFMECRDARKMTKTDMAGVLQLHQSTISRAEAASSNPWPLFFEPLQTIQAYAGSDPERQRMLEQKVYACFYPQGFASLQDLVRCVAHRSGLSVDDAGRALGVENLSAKLNTKRGNALSVRDMVALRQYVSAAREWLTLLDITGEHIESLLPNPLRIAQDRPFSEVLDSWAMLAAGEKSAFVEQVSQSLCRPFASNSLYGWGRGIGLNGVLEPIIAVLRSNPYTKDTFPDHESAFREAAQAVMKKPRRAGDESAPTHLARIEARDAAAGDSLSR